MFFNYLLMFFITLLVLTVLRRAAPRLGLMDTPGGHRHHRESTPMVGGLAIFTGFFFGVLLVDVPLSSFRPLFLGSGIVVLIGVLDDVHELSSLSRFVAQIIAALVMVWAGNVVLLDLGDLVAGGPVTLGRWAVPLTVFAVVGVINAMNMVDGMDGLAGGLFLVAFAGLAWVSPASGVRADTPMLVMLMLGIICFLAFNTRLGIRSHASVFLGDSGSMFLGFVLAWFLVDYSQKPLSVLQPVTALWLVGIPLIDTVAVMLRRILLWRSPFTADRTHIHHLLLHAGLGVNGALCAILATAAAMAAAGLASERAGWSEAARFGAFLGLFVAYFAVTTWYVNARGLSASARSDRSNR